MSAPSTLSVAAVPFELPVASPVVDCSSEPVNTREADIARVKAAITDYAREYGWSAVGMDLLPWIEERLP